VSTDRLLGSYLVRVTLGPRGRQVTVHSVLTGERRACADVDELAAYLDGATDSAAALLQQQASDGHTTERAGDESGDASGDG
jgi:hypothetical protein